MGGRRKRRREEPIGNEGDTKKNGLRAEKRDGKRRGGEGKGGMLQRGSVAQCL